MNFIDPLGLADVTILPQRNDEKEPQDKAEQKMIKYWQEEQKRRQREEELRRIRDYQRKERESNEQARKGRPTDSRPDKDD